VGGCHVRRLGAVQRRLPHPVDRHAGTDRRTRRRVPQTRRRSILGAFLHFQEEIEYFGADVLPVVRELEAAEQDSVDKPVLISA
jgi:dimethylsulfone monooxygenase